ncbi:metal-dependent hydrolase [Halalkalibacillus sediminis]|uniref:Metal-dependent hydrolase n=1 Tax=Halalkalibacillus sediminis TaxID=2018042 RepID=A0A2I0QRK2_9BACI|nr:metal-dependent hydrolase [Halalkalibacillus sediminis]PKR76964.1 metal-dependent hydrolase [Halalkalibacillus sediminis]
MMASGHQAMGLTWGIAAITFSHLLPLSIDGWTEWIFFLGIVLLGALLPDMDSPTSKIGRWLYSSIGILFLAFVIIYWQKPDWIWNFVEAELTFVLLLAVPIFLVASTHRTWTHSLAFIGILIIYLGLMEAWVTVPFYLQVGLILGVASHIFGDFITKRGVPLFYPILRKSFRFLVTFRTGSPTEKRIVLLLMLLNIWLIASTFNLG